MRSLERRHPPKQRTLRGVQERAERALVNKCTALLRIRPAHSLHVEWCFPLTLSVAGPCVRLHCVDHHKRQDHVAAFVSEHRLLGPGMYADRVADDGDLS